MRNRKARGAILLELIALTTVALILWFGYPSLVHEWNMRVERLWETRSRYLGVSGWRP